MITHGELVEAGRKYLMSLMGCQVVLTEIKTALRESPDVIGWSGTYCYVIECKVSRNDFLSDKKKPFRKYPEYGLGAERYYLVPEGLITREDLPEKWGLLYWTGKRIRNELRAIPFREYNKQGERQIMISVLRRLKILPGQGCSIKSYTIETKNRTTFTRMAI